MPVLMGGWVCTEVGGATLRHFSQRVVKGPSFWPSGSCSSSLHMHMFMHMHMQPRCTLAPSHPRPHSVTIIPSTPLLFCHSSLILSSSSPSLLFGTRKHMSCSSKQCARLHCIFWPFAPTVSSTVPRSLTLPLGFFTFSASSCSSVPVAIASAPGPLDLFFDVVPPRLHFNLGLLPSRATFASQS